MLIDAGAIVWSSTAEVPVDQRIDVVITDQPDTPRNRYDQGAPVVDGRAGLICIGMDGPADVTLPVDATAGEIRTASLLLTEIVRLRQQHRRANRARKVLAKLALSDPLTGLANRRAWDEELSTRVDGAGGDPGPLCLVLMDLDRFKHVNDEWGHTAGDQVLQAAAQALLANIRDQDFVARLGGDEFGLLLAGVGPQAAVQVVERIRRAVCDRLQHDKMPVATACAGFATSGIGLTAKQLLESADCALRQAKRSGRDRSCPSA